MIDLPPSLKISRWAIASLVLGILSIPFFFLKIGSLAVIAGIVAVAIIIRRKARGLWMAICGILLGILSIILLSIPFSTYFQTALKMHNVPQSSLPSATSTPSSSVSPAQSNADLLNTEVYQDPTFGFSISRPSAWRLINENYIAAPASQGVQFAKISETHPDCERCFGGASLSVLVYAAADLQKIGPDPLRFFDQGSIDGVTKATRGTFQGHTAIFTEAKNTTNDQYMGQVLEEKTIAFQEGDRVFAITYRADITAGVGDALSALQQSFRLED